MNFKPLRNFSTKINFGKPTYIVAAKRTPVATFLGKLSKFKGPELGSIAIKSALHSINLLGTDVNEVIMGTVCQAGQGQNPTRQASLGGGVGINVPCTTVNKVCSSGLKSVVYGAMTVGLGINQIVVTGGFESMSNAPFLVTNHRKGHSFGNTPLIDALAYDGLTDAYLNISMGLCAEKTAADFKMDRKLLDDYTITTYERNVLANKNGVFKNEIVPVKINEKETISEDDEFKRFMKEKIPLLKPAFSKTGIVTAANSSKINDAGCAIVLMSEEKLKEHNLKPLARIVGYADAETEPIDFCIAPAKSIQNLLQNTGMTLPQIEYFEISEAFAVTILANLKLLDLDIDRVNIYGGAISMGHPIGMSGSRILLSLMSALKNNKAKYGVASLCNGGGGSTAMLIENLQN